jgi:hypothetical protein
MKLQAVLRRKDILLSCIPMEDIKDGIKIEFDRDTDTELKYATININKGQRKYLKPRTNRKVIKATINV